MTTASRNPVDVFDGRTFDAVLFDMDGTLISSIHVTERCWGVWMQECGYQPEHYHQFHGTPARAIIEQLVPQEDREAAFQRILALEMGSTDGIITMAGAAEAVAAIPPSRRAIVTSSTRDLALVRLGITGLGMDTMVTADDVDNGKPHPDPFLLAARLLGVDPQRCLVIEDAPSGLRAGRAAGCATLGVPGTHNLEDLDADAVIESLDHIRFIYDDMAGIRIIAA